MKPEVLVLTVGTGNAQSLEETLFRPLEKSLETGKWREAVLLPSAMTKDNAQAFRDRMSGHVISIERLPQENQENDADACFRHFDKVLSGLKEKGYEADAITPDFTRGTKAMSAALVLAAVRHGIPKLRYIWGPRDNRGMVLAGQEQVGDVATVYVTMRRRLDDARQLMQRGAFAAVAELLPDLDGAQPAAGRVPEGLRGEISRMRNLAAFWSSWDRLDYGQAAQDANELGANDREELVNEIAFVKKLAEKPQQDNHRDMAEWLRHVATDLLANGRRSIKRHQFEDALLRAYRVLELIGQFRLFERGHDSARIDPQHPEVRKLRKDLKKKGSADFGIQEENGRQVLTAPKALTARLLNRLGDPLGKKLTEFDERGSSVKARERNESILIHGFAVADLDEEALSELYDRIAALLDEAAPDEGNRMDPGRFGTVP